MKLEEGKKYILRNGDVTKKLKCYENCDRDYRFFDKKTMYSFTDDGKYWLTGERSERDIVREYKKKKNNNMEI